MEWSTEKDSPGEVCHTEPVMVRGPNGADPIQVCGYAIHHYDDEQGFELFDDDGEGNGDYMDAFDTLEAAQEHARAQRERDGAQVMAMEPDDVTKDQLPEDDPDADYPGQPWGPSWTNEAGVKFVNVYMVRRCYGGSEEGGWWFDAGELLETVVVASADAEERAKALEAQYSNEGRRPLSSVLSSGEFRVSVDDKPGEDYPRERPHYE